MDLIALTQSTAGVLKVAGQQHMIAAAGLGEYTSLAQTGATTAQKAQVRSTEIGVREVGARQQQKAKLSFRDWLKQRLNTSTKGFQKLFGNLLYLGGLDSAGQRNQKQLAFAIRELNQALGSLSRAPSTAFQVEDSHNVMVRRAKAHFIQGGSGVYVDGGPAIVLQAVSTVLRANGFLVEADIVGVVGDSEVHRLANAYTLDAKKLAMMLRDSARLQADKIHLVGDTRLGTPTNYIQAGPSGVRLVCGLSTIDMAVPGASQVADIQAAIDKANEGKDETDPTYLPTPDLTDLSGAVPLPAIITLTGPMINVSGALNAIPTWVPGLPIVGTPSLDLVKNPLVTNGVNSTAVGATQDPKTQTAMPQWKGHLPQPWV